MPESSVFCEQTAFSSNLEVTGNIKVPMTKDILLAYTCSKSTMKTTKYYFKFVQSWGYKHQKDANDVVLVLLLTLHRFPTMFWFSLSTFNKKISLGSASTYFKTKISILPKTFHNISWNLRSEQWLVNSMYCTLKYHSNFLPILLVSLGTVNMPHQKRKRGLLAQQLLIHFPHLWESNIKGFNMVINIFKIHDPVDKLVKAQNIDLLN